MRNFAAYIYSEISLQSGVMHKVTGISQMPVTLKPIRSPLFLN
ncbi:MAG: hypothetical protein R3C14_42165 [Caldilineaceae bacterium]